MKPELECGVCLLGWVYGRAAAGSGDRDSPRLFRKVIDFVSEEITDTSNLACCATGQLPLSTNS